MIDAGINEGDIIICKRCDTAENGDIVVALVEKEEATPKRLRKKGASMALEAANPDYETCIFGPTSRHRGPPRGTDPSILMAPVIRKPRPAEAIRDRVLPRLGSRL